MTKIALKKSCEKNLWTKVSLESCMHKLLKKMLSTVVNKIFNDILLLTKFVKKLLTKAYNKTCSQNIINKNCLQLYKMTFVNNHTQNATGT